MALSSPSQSALAHATYDLDVRLGPERLPALHRDAIAHPFEFLHWSISSGPRIPDGSLPIRFSPERGYLPILHEPVPAPTGRSDVSEVYVVANGAAQLHNSPVFLNRDEAQNREVLAANISATSHAMIGYSLPSDVLVIQSSDEAASTVVLDRIRESYAGIGQQLTQRVSFVPSVEGWMQEAAGTRPIVASVIEPSLLLSYARTPEQIGAYTRTGLAHIAAYTKDGAERMWAEGGVPTPRTAYYDLSQLTALEFVTAVRKEFSQYPSVVASRLDGCGGYGLYHWTLADQSGMHIYERLGSVGVQVQAYLPLTDSPGVIADISPSGCEILGASSQRFRHFGAHSGNWWSRSYMSELEREHEGLRDTLMDAFDHLRCAGVIGQVNVDLLLVSRETAARYELPGTVFLREANIRPGGSSVLLRLREGSIDGTPIDKIMTGAMGGVSPDEVIAPGFVDTINSLRRPGVTAIAMYNYDLATRRASFAFMGTEDSTREELQATESALATLITRA